MKNSLDVIQIQEYYKNNDSDRLGKQQVNRISDMQQQQSYSQGSLFCIEGSSNLLC